MSDQIQSAEDGASSTQATSQTATENSDATLLGGEGEKVANTQQSATAEGDQPDADKAADAAKPAEDDNAESKPGDAKPIEYTDFTFPEGLKADEATLSELTDFAKSKGLSQEDVQKLVDLGSRSLLKTANDQIEALNQANVEWETGSRSDPEFGGVKLDENLAISKKALDAFTTPQFRELLVKTKLGNHPEVIRTFFRIGKSLSEDGIVTSEGASERRAPEDILYGNKSTT